MATQIKITELGNITIGDLTYTALFPTVNMVGTPITQKATLQQIGAVILSSAGGANFPAANIANISYNVVNASQPNITSVGTLTSLTVSGNVTVGGGNILTKATTAYNTSRTTTVTVDNIIARVAVDGKAQISVGAGNVTVIWSGYEIISGTHAAFNNAGALVVSGVWQDLTASSLTTSGDTIVAIVQADGHIYRITYVQTLNNANSSVVIEKLI